MAADNRTAPSNDDDYTHIVCDIRHFIGSRRTTPHARCGASLVAAGRGVAHSDPADCPGCVAIQGGMDARRSCRD